MNELKAETIIKAGIRIAEKNLTSAYIVKRGDEQAGAIFVKINTLDGLAHHDKLIIISSFCCHCNP